MAEPIFSWDDACNKLNGSIIMWKGAPHRCILDSLEWNRNLVGVRPLLNYNVAQTEFVNYKDDDFDYNQIELGMYRSTEPNISWSGHLCRKPGRFSNLGLIVNNLDSFLNSRNFFSTFMHNCIMGIHPTFEQAKEELWSSEGEMIPFHRHAALMLNNSYNGVIVYMTTEIAHITRDRVTPFDNISKTNGKLLTKLGVPHHE